MDNHNLLFVSVEINYAIAILAVWHNYLNWVHLVWSHNTYLHFTIGHGATMGIMNIRSFSWKKWTTNKVQTGTFLWGWAVLLAKMQNLMGKNVF